MGKGQSSAVSWQWDEPAAGVWKLCCREGGSMVSRGLSRTLRHRWALICVVGVLLAGAGIVRATRPVAHASVAAPTSVSVSWGETTALVQWAPVSGATGYEVTLIRLKDMGIMEQFRVPANQLAADAQGIWPNEQYEVAVQAVDATGALSSTATMSATGWSEPISRTTYNGFLDQENRAAGQIDTNMWDEQVSYQGNIALCGNTFVNGQLHYHIQAGCPVSGAEGSGRQTTNVQTARVPVDWTNRTATIHGAVDLKGDQHQWFGVLLSPQIPGSDRVLDLVDRFGYPIHSMPMVELFTFHGRTHLLYAEGNGTEPRDLGSIPNPRGYNNVRDDIVWHVSAGHTTILIDGQTAFNLDFPLPLAFTHGYLSLFAVDYPNSGGTNGQPACDVAPTGDCSVWHLDNWGFDAPAGQVQPTSHAYYAQGCSAYAGGEGQTQIAQQCDLRNTNDVGANPSVSVPNVSASNLTDAGVVFSVENLHSQGALTLDVNGHAALAVPDIASEYNTDNTMAYRVDVPTSDLVSGVNTVNFHFDVSKNGGTDQLKLSNVQIETVSSTPYAPPALPAEPAPLGTWNGRSE